jgi:hypothetical protein
VEAARVEAARAEAARVEVAQAEAEAWAESGAWAGSEAWAESGESAEQAGPESVSDRLSHNQIERVTPLYLLLRGEKRIWE